MVGFQELEDRKDAKKAERFQVQMAELESTVHPRAHRCSYLVPQPETLVLTTVTDK